MTYNDFLKLVDGRETTRVDFKIECHAFLTSSPQCESAKAELAKDICAMANNGPVASYILVGVADDGIGAKSVTNSNLTDDRLQSFCKTAISPPVKIRVHQGTWAKTHKANAGKSFVAIQVGPNARHAYHLNIDFIDLKGQDVACGAFAT